MYRDRQFSLAAVWLLLGAGPILAQPDHHVLRMPGGTLNGAPIDASHYEIVVAPGGSIAGSIVVETYNSMGAGSVAPLGWTVTWGLREDQAKLTNGWIGTGTNTYTVNVDATAPTTPGDYHIIIAFAGRYTIDQVMSETKQDVPGNPIWYDGNDMGFDWTQEQINDALFVGTVDSTVLGTEGYGTHRPGASAVIVHVGCYEPTPAEQIVFGGGIDSSDPNDVFSMHPDGTDVVNLTMDFTPDAGGRLDVSPDGSKIAFMIGSPNAIWVMNADGTNPQPVRDGGAGGVATPRWYANDILFYAYTTSHSCPYSVQIRSITFDGVQWTNDTLVVENASAIGQNTTETLDISPDRTKLAWDAQIGCWSPTYDIYICDLNGTVCTNPRAFYTDPGDDNSDNTPKWASDSRTVYWEHAINAGVDQPRGFAWKTTDSPLPVTAYDGLLRPDLDCGIQLTVGSTLSDLSPDASLLLFWAKSARALYTYHVTGHACELILAIDHFGGAYWGDRVVGSDCNGNGMVDGCDIENGTSGDCNASGIPDECEIADGTSQDCNGNDVPDECEIDKGSTAPGGPFFCDPLAPPVGLDTCDPDCNSSGVPDACDIATGYSDDLNVNGVPDECEFCPTSPAEVERLGLPGDPVSRKIRYLSFTAGEAGRSQAIRVTFQNVPAPYAHWNGTQLWVQEPERYCENAGQRTVPAPSSPPNYGCGSSGGVSPAWFWGTDVGCDPYFADWTQYGVVHVWNEGVIPLGVYDVQVIDEICARDTEGSYSTPLTMTQSRWGDLISNCTTNPCGPPDNTTGISTDVTALLDKWKNLPGNVTKARADIEGSPSGDHRLPDQAINITDVTVCLGAFLGQTYPPPGYPPPGNPPECE